MLLNGYGMVELGGLAMMGIETSLFPGGGDLCFPVPPFKIRVADENGRPVRAGVTGECQIRRRGLSPHYWKDKVRDQELLTEDGWLRTGDLATRNRLGLIRLVGRIKDVIKSGGYSVYVRELEETIGHILQSPAPPHSAYPTRKKAKSPPAAVELHNGSSATKPICSIGAAKSSPHTKPRAESGSSMKGMIKRKSRYLRFSAVIHSAGPRLGEDGKQHKGGEEDDPPARHEAVPGHDQREDAES